MGLYLGGHISGWTFVRDFTVSEILIRNNALVSIAYIIFENRVNG